MIRPECNCLKSLMGYLRRESAPTPNLTCVTFYFLVRNLISLKNINTINSSFLLCRGFYVEHRGCTEWLKQINLSILLMLTLPLKISKMAKIQNVKISDISDMINWNLFMLLIYVTPYSGSCKCDDTSKYRQNSVHFFPHLYRSHVFLHLHVQWGPSCVCDSLDLFMLRHTLLNQQWKIDKW